MSMAWANAFASLGQGVAGIGQSITRYAMYNAEQSYREKERQDGLRRNQAYLKAQGIDWDPETGEATWSPHVIAQRESDLESAGVNRDYYRSLIERNEAAAAYDAARLEALSGAGGGGFGFGGGGVGGGGSFGIDDLQDLVKPPKYLVSFDAYKDEFGSDSDLMPDQMDDSSLRDSYRQAKTAWFSQTANTLAAGGMQHLVGPLLSNEMKEFSDSMPSGGPSMGGEDEEDGGGGIIGGIGNFLGSAAGLGKNAMGGLSRMLGFDEQVGLLRDNLAPGARPSVRETIEAAADIAAGPLGAAKAGIMSDETIPGAVGSAKARMMSGELPDMPGPDIPGAVGAAKAGIMNMGSSIIDASSADPPQSGVPTIGPDLSVPGMRSFSGQPMHPNPTVRFLPSRDMFEPRGTPAPKVDPAIMDLFPGASPAIPGLNRGMDWVKQLFQPLDPNSPQPKVDPRRMDLIGAEIIDASTRRTRPSYMR